MAFFSSLNPFLAFFLCQHFLPLSITTAATFLSLICLLVMPPPLQSPSETHHGWALTTRFASLSYLPLTPFSWIWLLFHVSSPQINLINSPNKFLLSDLRVPSTLRLDLPPGLQPRQTGLRDSSKKIYKIWAGRQASHRRSSQWLGPGPPSSAWMKNSKVMGAMDKLRILHIKFMIFAVTTKSYSMPSRCLS